MKKAIEWMQKIQIAVGGFFLCIFLLTVVFQMLSRYIGIAATWTEDVSMYSFIWAVFMGAGAMVYEKRHFAFTSVSDMLKNEKIKSVLAIIIYLVMLVFAVLMAYYGYGCFISSNVYRFCCHWCADLIRTWRCIFYRYRISGTDSEFSCIPENV